MKTYNSYLPPGGPAQYVEELQAQLRDEPQGVPRVVQGGDDPRGGTECLLL